MTEPLRLDLGSGPRPKAGFKGVDKIPGLTDYCVDFRRGTPWPFADSSIDELRSAHCIEHIPALDVLVWQRVKPEHQERMRDCTFDPAYGDLVWVDGCAWAPSSREQDLLFLFFEEAYRVAKPGAKFEVRCPSVQHYLAHGDPTHRRCISHDLIQYIGAEGRRVREVEFYDVRCNWTGRVELGCELPKGVEPGTEAAASHAADAGRRMHREWNAGHELIFYLEAVK